MAPVYVQDKATVQKPDAQRSQSTNPKEKEGNGKAPTPQPLPSSDGYIEPVRPHGKLNLDGFNRNFQANTERLKPEEIEASLRQNLGVTNAQRAENLKSIKPGHYPDGEGGTYLVAQLENQGVAVTSLMHLTSQNVRYGYQVDQTGQVTLTIGRPNLGVDALIMKASAKVLRAHYNEAIAEFRAQELPIDSMRAGTIAKGDSSASQNPAFKQADRMENRSDEHNREILIGWRKFSQEIKNNFLPGEEHQVTDGEGGQFIVSRGKDDLITIKHRLSSGESYEWRLPANLGNDPNKFFHGKLNDIKENADTIANKVIEDKLRNK